MLKIFQVLALNLKENMSSVRYKIYRKNRGVTIF
jgi:hypothetical protein